MRETRAGMVNGIYRPGQAEVLFEFWPDDAEWFVIGGPADGDEAQTVKEKYPNIGVIGFEPNRQMRLRQQRAGFPGPLLTYALSDIEGNTILRVPKGMPRSSTIRRDLTGLSCLKETVTAATLDNTSNREGPFTNVVLWIDIEEAELRCLKGARKLLESGRILLINLEVMNVEQLSEITEFLSQYGLREVKRWGQTKPGKCDVIFKKEQS